MSPTLIISNDFGPRIGGIESFVEQACRILQGQVVVLTSHARGDAEHDRRLGFPVVRHGRVLLPTRAVAALAVAAMRRHGCDRVLFGAAAPLGLLAPVLRRAGARRLVALSHGHEVWWARVPAARSALRRIGEDVDAFSVISDHTAAAIGPALSAAGRRRMIMIPPPVDPALFTLERESPQPGRVPRCLAVARFVAQKNLVTLLAAWRRLRHGPDPVDAELVLVGDGPQAGRLRQCVRRWDLQDSVHFTGPLDPHQVRRELAGAQLFALPVRTRLAGLNPEGLGLVFCEAAAAGLPVIVGRSGGAPETVVDGETGFVVEPTDVDMLVDRLRLLLTRPELARAMGAAGRAFVAQRYGPELLAGRLRAALGLDAAR